MNGIKKKLSEVYNKEIKKKKLQRIRSHNNNIQQNYPTYLQQFFDRHFSTFGFFIVTRMDGVYSYENAVSRLSRRKHSLKAQSQGWPPFEGTLFSTTVSMFSYQFTKVLYIHNILVTHWRELFRFTPTTHTYNTTLFFLFRQIY